MPTEQRIHYMVIPNGVSGGKHRISVVVSPRLRIKDAIGRLLDGDLSDFPDWVDWPAKVKNISWNLRLERSGQAVKKPSVSRVSADPSSERWTQLFSPSLRVQSHRYPKLAEQQIASYPTDHVRAYLSNKYSDLAQSVNPPPIEQIQQTYSQIDVLNDNEQIGVGEQITSILNQLGNNSVVTRSATPRPTKDFTQAALFFAPSLNTQAVAAARARTQRTPPLIDFFKVNQRPPRPVAPELDFHQAVTGLANHPQLMRLLGLVVDLEFTSPFSGDDISADIWVEPALPGSRGVRVNTMKLRTRSRIGPNRFVARSRDAEPEVEAGLLKMSAKLSDGRPEYSLIDFDVDGAALKTLKFVNDVSRSINGQHDTIDTPAQQPPPAFRSAGVSIVRTGRDGALRKRLDRQKAINDALDKREPDEFFDLVAEDLTRGYAYDVYDPVSAQWHPLCARQGSAIFSHDPADPDPAKAEDLEPEDGWVATGVTQAKSLGDETVKVGETMARWANGWSMVTARPGKTVDPDDQAVPYEQQLGNIGLSVRYTTPPGTLPPQRFGRAYRFRGRAVDLAGNALTLEQANALGNKNTLQLDGYKRAEPVSPPTVIQRQPITAGESTTTMVVRSDAGSNPEPGAWTDRHLFPPSLDQFRTECHGVWDLEGAGLNATAELFAMLEGRADNSYDSTVGDQLKHPGAQRDTGNHGAVYYDVDAPEFLVEGDALAAMPSLPDPLAEGVAMENMPGDPDGRWEESFYRSDGWPMTTPIRMRLRHASGPTADAPEFAGRELVIRLPKADDVELHVSSRLPEGALSLFRPWSFLLASGLGSSQLTALGAEIQRGKHWGFTPARKIRLVHAVRRPLRPTTFSGLPQLVRAAGQSHVTVTNAMQTSRKSTERVEVRAEWKEKFDWIGPSGAWYPEREVPRSGVAFQKEIELDASSDGSIPVAERHELGHTRHIPAIRYETTATTRFREYFTERIDGVYIDSNGEPVDLPPSIYSGAAAGGQGIVPDSVSVTSADNAVVYKEGQHYEVDYDANTLRSIDGMEEQEATITYIRSPITQQSPAPISARAVSSARPAAPKPLYAVPAFTWDRVEGTNTKRSKRGGGSLRVYLDRPWWSSGDEEKLAVVMWPALGQNKGKSLPRALGPYVSQRGLDPIWGSARTDRLLRPAEFTNRGGEAASLQLAETSEHRVAIAWFDVHPNLTEEGGVPDPVDPRWYCDIDISAASAYTPFIRLALARYQSHSVSGVELSSVALLDFMQLMPDRAATIVRDGNGYNVTVTGRSYKSGAESVPANAVITADLETRRTGMEETDDAVGWAGLDETVTLTASTNPITHVTTWTGRVTAADFPGRFRIAIREFEQFKRQTPEPGQSEFARRLVYADAIPL